MALDLVPSMQTLTLSRNSLYVSGDAARLCTFCKEARITPILSCKNSNCVWLASMLDIGNRYSLISCATEVSKLEYSPLSLLDCFLFLAPVVNFRCSAFLPLSYKFCKLLKLDDISLVLTLIPHNLPNL